MSKPFLIIVNGPPGVGKTTLSQRLAQDLQLPVINRDEIAETLFEGLDCDTHGRPTLIGPASFKLVHYFASKILAAFAQHHQHRISCGHYPRLALGGQAHEVNMTNLNTYNYTGVLNFIKTTLLVTS